MKMFKFETYKKEDYIFIDENGNEFISTPACDDSIAIAIISILGVTSPFWIVLSFWSLL